MSKVISFFKRQANPDDRFQRLLAPHIDLLYGQAYKYTGNAESAEDLLQDLLLEMYQKLDRLETVAAPKSWLMRCLYNRFVDSYRKQKTLPQFDNIHDEQTTRGIAHVETPESHHWHRQILQGLGQLRAEQRMVISLHDIEGYTLSELSEIMQMPLGTLKSHLHRGRKALQQKLKLQPFEGTARYL